MDGRPLRLFAIGGARGSQGAPWIQNGRTYLFILKRSRYPSEPIPVRVLTVTRPGPRASPDYCATR